MAKTYTEIKTEIANDITSKTAKKSITKTAVGGAIGDVLDYVNEIDKSLQRSFNNNDLPTDFSWYKNNGVGVAVTYDTTTSSWKTMKVSAYGVSDIKISASLIANNTAPNVIFVDGDMKTISIINTADSSVRYSVPSGTEYILINHKYSASFDFELKLYDYGDSVRSNTNIVSKLEKVSSISKSASLVAGTSATITIQCDIKNGDEYAVNISASNITSYSIIQNAIGNNAKNRFGESLSGAKPNRNNDCVAVGDVSQIIIYISGSKVTSNGDITITISTIANGVMQLVATPNIFVPMYFYAAVGQQKCIYNDGFGLPYIYDVSLLSADALKSNAKDKRKERCTYLTPTSAGNIDVKMKAYLCGNLAKSTSARIKTMEAVNPNTSKNILWIGDSISDYKNSARFCKALFDGVSGGVSPTFVGTNHTSYTPDEAYAGMDMRWFVTDTPPITTANHSPFVIDGNLDISAYKSSLGVGNIDACVIELGYNDAQCVLDGTYTLESCKNQWKTLIEALTSANNNIKIVIVLTAHESHWSWNYNKQYKRDGINAIRLMQNELSQEYNNVILSDAMYCIDPIYGYMDKTNDNGLADVYSGSGYTEKCCIDSTHPSELGCKEWARNVYPALLYAFSL